MYVIIGQGAAGTSAANTLRSLDSKVPITVITDELDFFYSRIDLPGILSGKYSPQDSIRQTSEEFAEKSIACRMGETVEEILADEKVVLLASGEKIPYDKLLIATGSLPVVPPIKGSDASGVHVLWTMDQARTMIDAATEAKSVVVIGAGLIGMKAAQALRKRGLKVMVVEKLPYILPRQLDEAAARIIEKQIQAMGIELRTGTGVEEIEVSDGKVTGVLLQNERVACDLIVMAVGVKPNTALAASAGVNVGRGIVIDEYLRTSIPDIYAAGDVTEVFDSGSEAYVVPAIWPVAVEHGQLAAWNMLGLDKPFVYTAAMNSVEIADVPIISVGDIKGSSQDQILINQQGTNYKKVVMRGKTVRGVLFLGNICQAGVLANLVIRQAEFEIDRPLSSAFSFADLLAI